MNIREQLAVLGIDGQIYKQGKEMKICCPFHDDHNPSFSINLETGVWICYSQCGGGDWIEFVERVRQDERYAPLAMAESRPEQPKAPVLKSLLARGFTREILVKWGIEWDPDVGAMRLPLLDRTGRPQSRIWRFPEGVSPKYRYEEGFQRSETLYGLWKVSPKPVDIVLVEGPLDTIWVHEAGWDGLAILGSSLSETQAKIIRHLKAKRILLCFDNDPAGAVATEKAAKLLKREGCWVYRVKLSQRWKDIQEVPCDRVNSVLGQVELNVNGKGMVHPKFQRWMPRSERKIASGIWRTQ